MRTILTRSALAMLLGLTGLPLGASFASAQGVELRIDRDGARMHRRERCDPDFEDCRMDRDRDFGERERGCTPERALWKAERMGIRRARVVDMDRRTIDVRGRDRRGDRVIVTF
ncbi:MAG: hypothetical protein J0H34_17075, partial [Rhizobiales bacterium]|nr:hypothetical protein [Hyphomicrobiales bacterium]